MKKTIVTLALLVASTVCGALPPLVQNSRELQAILSDGRLFQALGSAGLFHSIVKVDGGYLIMTRDHALRVDVEYLQSAVAGPVPFELHFYEPLNVNGDVEGDNRNDVN